MLTYRIWTVITIIHGGNSREVQWTRDGWFLFGIVPLIVRDLQNRSEFNERQAR